MSERRGFTAAVLLLLGGVGCSRKSEAEATAKRVAAMKHEPWVLWPDGTPPAGGWPVLLFLHGQGEAAWVDRDGEVVEHGPDAVLAHGSPAALFKARDQRVKTLWQSFVLIAPQAVNDEGDVRWWRWEHESVKRQVAAEVEKLLGSGKVNAQRVCATGFSRGGLGCYQLDSSTGPLQFRKIVTADAQGLDGLPEVVKRGRELRAYYTPSTYEKIRKAHRAAETTHGKASPPVSIIAMQQGGNEGEAHIAMCSRVFADDEVYRWLLA